MYSNRSRPSLSSAASAAAQAKSRSAGQLAEPAQLRPPDASPSTESFCTAPSVTVTVECPPEDEHQDDQPAR